MIARMIECLVGLQLFDENKYLTSLMIFSPGDSSLDTSLQSKQHVYGGDSSVRDMDEPEMPSNTSQLSQRVL